ncbi:hypothetical protein CUZ56_00881 [Saezia sanguinis]|jgi:type IV pilus assembly protein PilP|uniref:Pilus assembly protein PilP n=1 Tax=Saezia sanguinis TaxID=1965230 RepID=A0A433SE81_9BURK|nr:pilus assembly protein PilP [Saezia sanguinis]RUS66944.1 hypothetical protein CUZ56_00881 [Saezia sanguinis]
MSKFAFKMICLTTAAFVVAGCTGSTSDLEEWTQQQRRTVPPAPLDVKAPPEFVPYAYNGIGLPNPFSTSKLTAVLQPTGDTTKEPPEVTDKRDPEPLESVPLEAITMVGSMSMPQTNQDVALLSVDGFIHQVKVGNYIGMNYGKILRITETTIDLREWVKTGQGEWIERPVTLHLQEGQS